MPTKNHGEALSPSEVNLKPDVHRVADLGLLASLNPNPALETSLSHALVPGFGLYRYDSLSTATVDGILVVTAAPGGRWLRTPERLAAPAAPTIAHNSGQAGTLALVAALVTARTPDLVAYLLEYDWTPSATTTAWTAFAVTPPAGWTVATIAVGAATAATDVLARPSAIRSATAFLVRNEVTAAQRLVASVAIARA